MAASAEMEAQLVHLVQESLAQYLHKNACFMCERLVADFPTEVRSQDASLHYLSQHSDGVAAR
jgi:anaphase-promoting complex subunit 3